MDGKVDSKENRQIEPNQIVTEAAFNWYNNICSAVESRFSGFDNPSTYYKTHLRKLKEAQGK